MIITKFHLKNIQFKISFIAIFSLILILKGYSQNKINLCSYTNILNLSDSVYGDNDIVENGIIYRFPNNRITGTPFLNGDVWNKSILYIGGEKYCKYLVKYDLINDVLVIKVSLNNVKTVYIKANKFITDSFFIENKKFVNTNIFDSCTIKSNYMQELFSGNLSFFRVFNKSFIDIYDEKKPYGKFSETKSDLYVYNGEQFIQINKKRILLNIFKTEETKKEVSSFLKHYKNNLTKISPDDLISIITYCNLIYEKSRNN